MSHSRNSRAIRDLRDSDLRPFDVPTQAERDREANEIIRDLADRDDWDETTVRVDIPTAEIVAEHSAPPAFPEFAPRAVAEVYTMDDYRDGLDVTQELPALNDEPSWLQTIKMGIVDALKEVIS
jgi:hypothetical protein